MEKSKQLNHATQKRHAKCKTFFANGSHYHRRARIKELISQLSDEELQTIVFLIVVKVIPTLKFVISRCSSRYWQRRLSIHKNYTKREGRFLHPGFGTISHRFACMKLSVIRQHINLLQAQPKVMFGLYMTGIAAVLTTQAEYKETFIEINAGLLFSLPICQKQYQNTCSGKGEPSTKEDYQKLILSQQMMNNMMRMRNRKSIPTTSSSAKVKRKLKSEENGKLTLSGIIILL